MPLDPNIILGGKSVEIQNPMNALAQMLQVKHLQQQGQAQEFALQEQQRGVDNQNKLREILSRQGDQSSPEFLRAISGIDPAFAEKIQKNRQEQLKSNADIELSQAHAKNFNQQTASSEAANKFIAASHHEQLISTVNNMGDVVNYVNSGIDKGIFPPMTPEQIQEKLMKYNGNVEAWKSDAIKNATPVLEGLKAQALKAHQDQVDVTTRRGQDMTNARSREATSTSMSKPFEVTGDDGSPILVQQNKQGKIIPVDGYTAKTAVLKQIPPSVNKAIIENAGNISKVDKALALLEENNDAVGMKGYTPNFLLNRMNPKGTETRAAITDIGSLILHDRSGAAVTASETPRLLPFIPLATDDKATAQKKLKRFKEIYAEENNAMGEIYSKEQGYRPSPLLNKSKVQDSGKPTTTQSGATVSNW